MQQVAIERVHELELASDYLFVARRINRSAFPIVLFGAMNLVFVFASPAPTPYHIALFVDGLGLIGVGIYMMRSFRPVTMLLSALLLWSSAFWYLFWWHGILTLPGLFVIWKGGQEFGRWRRFRGHFNSPKDAIVREAEEIARAVQDSVSKRSPLSLELYVSGDRWLAMLSGSVIAFFKPEQKLLLVPVGVLEIHPEGHTVVGGFCKVLIRIPSQKPLHATLVPENLERLAGWCAGAGAKAPHKTAAGGTAEAAP